MGHPDLSLLPFVGGNRLWQRGFEISLNLAEIMKRGSELPRFQQVKKSSFNLSWLVVWLPSIYIFPYELGFSHHPN